MNANPPSERPGGVDRITRLVDGLLILHRAEAGRCAWTAARWTWAGFSRGLLAAEGRFDSVIHLDLNSTEGVIIQGPQLRRLILSLADNAVNTPNRADA